MRMQVYGCRPSRFFSQLLSFVRFARRLISHKVTSKLGLGFSFASMVMLAGMPVRAELPVAQGGQASNSISSTTNPGWSASGTATATYNAANTRLDVNQNRTNDTFNWSSFNISNGSTVNFNQPSSESIALNRINQVDPSRIYGSLNANGRVYLINNNGFLFGKNSSVNVNSLVASTLNISDTVFENAGITGAINLADPAQRYAFSGGSDPDATIVIEQGAIITTQEQGRVLILAPHIINSGAIYTPGGQAILAGSYDQVLIQTDTNAGGMLVEVGTGGKGENLGSIIAERGNVSLVGLAVNQQGVVRATSSVDFNGSIRLVARHGASGFGAINTGGTQNTINTSVLSGDPAVSDPLQESGITLGSSSVTEVVANTVTDENGEQVTDPAMALDEQSQKLPGISLNAARVIMQGTDDNGTGAQLNARGGKVRIVGARDGTDPVGDFVMVHGLMSRATMSPWTHRATRL